MTHLPVVSAHSLESFLTGLGFEKVRQRGSHALYRHADGRVTVVPVHAGRDLATPLVRSILHALNITPPQFASLINA